MPIIEQNYVKRLLLGTWTQYSKQEWTGGSQYAEKEKAGELIAVIFLASLDYLKQK